MAAAARACEKRLVEQETPAEIAQRAALMARAALIVAAIAIALAILGLFLPF